MLKPGFGAVDGDKTADQQRDIDQIFTDMERRQNEILRSFRSNNISAFSSTQAKANQPPVARVVEDESPGFGFCIPCITHLYCGNGKIDFNFLGIVRYKGPGCC